LIGKPHAHVYVDDLAVHARLDTFKEIGALDIDDPAVIARSKNSKESTEELNQLKSMVPARSFNTVQVVQNLVVKSSQHSAILGEMFFYAHCPSPLAHRFPGLVEVDHQVETGYSSITMKKVNGITYSHLLLNRAVSKYYKKQLISSVPPKLF
jgi:hypothetical protein